MGLTWNLSALIATIAVLLIFGAVWNKARQRQDSPLYKLMEKMKGMKKENMDSDENKKYKRLSHRGGLKW